jgi:hypothetical protein
MPDFPFTPIPVGNFCKECCENCIAKLGDPLAQCCKSLSGGGKQCYSPTECKKCSTISNSPLTYKVLQYCQEDVDQSYMYEQKTSCCFGNCYDNRCYKCTGSNKDNSKVEPDYDPSVTLCCGGGRRDIGPSVKDRCKKCKTETKTITNSNGNTISYTEETIIENFCEIESPSTPACCYGACWDPSDVCFVCDDNEKRKIPKCKDPNPNCCGGTCWNSSNQCKICQETTDPGTGKIVKNLIDDPTCGECCNHSDGSAECCRPPLKCCSTTESCYDPKCEDC